MSVKPYAITLATTLGKSKPYLIPRGMRRLSVYVNASSWGASSTAACKLTWSNETEPETFHDFAPPVELHSGLTALRNLNVDGVRNVRLETITAEGSADADAEIEFTATNEDGATGSTVYETLGHLNPVANNDDALVTCNPGEQVVVENIHICNNSGLGAEGYTLHYDPNGSTVDNSTQMRKDGSVASSDDEDVDFKIRMNGGGRVIFNGTGNDNALTVFAFGYRIRP